MSENAPMPKTCEADDEVPEVYAIRREGSAWRLSRRDLAAVVAAVGAVATPGCGPKRRQRSEVRYQQRDETGRWMTHTAPCGSPIPPGAACICTCVPVAAPAPAPRPGGTYCRCVPVRHCTCVPVHYWYPN